MPGPFLSTAKGQLRSINSGMAEVSGDERMMFVAAEGLCDSADEKEEVG